MKTERGPRWVPLFLPGVSFRKWCNSLKSIIVLEEAFFRQTDRWQEHYQLGNGAPKDAHPDTLSNLQMPCETACCSLPITFHASQLVPYEK